MTNYAENSTDADLIAKILADLTDSEKARIQYLYHTVDHSRMQNIDMTKLGRCVFDIIKAGLLKRSDVPEIFPGTMSALGGLGVR